MSSNLPIKITGRVENGPQFERNHDVLPHLRSGTRKIELVLPTAMQSYTTSNVLELVCIQTWLRMQIPNFVHPIFLKQEHS